MSDSDMEVVSDTESQTSAPPPSVGCLAIRINDPRGNPKSELAFKIFVQNESVFSGKTDSESNVDVIENLKFGSVFDIHVKSDKGEYKKVATGRIDAEQNIACLKSPKTRFEFSTYINT